MIENKTFCRAYVTKMWKVAFEDNKNITLCDFDFYKKVYVDS